MSGHDSGFESMNRNNHTQHSSDAGILTHTGIHVSIVTNHMHVHVTIEVLIWILLVQ